jgi:lysophospholipase L1-like esterase
MQALCSNDNTHPNDLGFYLMAKKIAPVIEKLL